MKSLKYFGTSGIRGRTFIDITPHLAQSMAKAYSKVVIKEKKNSTVVIGRDPRYGSETIELASIIGLTTSGVSVIRCGIVPTPVLLTYLKHTKSDGAIMITGSHIPPDRIGLIYMESDGSYCSDSVSFEIEQIYEKINFEDNNQIQINSLTDLENIGTISMATDVYSIYETSLSNLVDVKLISSKKFKIAVDPGNGTGAHFFSNYLTKLGFEVHAINDTFAPKSDRLSEPIEENLSSIINLMDKDFDLGVAFDVDADRATFLTSSSGSIVINANKMGALLIKGILHDNPDGNIVLPINSSNLAEEVMADLKPIYCKIGQPGTIEQVKKTKNPLFSYEESGKFYFLHEGLLWTDGILVVLKVLEVIVKSNKSLEELINTLPEYYSLVDKISVEDTSMQKVISSLHHKMESYKFPDEKERITIDGYRINFADRDKTWLVLRPSGTEPKIRIMSNSANLEKCKLTIKQGKEFILDIINNLEEI